MKRPAFGHLLGYTALTVILTAGAAQSLSGTNTVDSGDIIDGTIGTPDLKTGSVSGTKILDNSVTGTDINESTLAIKKVFFARVASTGALMRGDATSAARTSTGNFTVTFPVSVRNCGVTGTAGSYSDNPTGNQSNPSTTVAANLEGSDLKVVHVVTVKSAAYFDNSFQIIVACP